MVVSYIVSTTGRGHKKVEDGIEETLAYCYP